MSKKNEISYDLIADEFAFGRGESKVDPEVVQFCDLLDKDSQILSIGCGSGLPNEKYLVDNHKFVTGVDISSNLLKMAHKNLPDSVFFEADVMSFKTDKQYDAILAWWSLFHLEPAEHEEVFRKIHGWLKDGGYFLFNHGGEEGEMWGEMHGENFYYSCPGPEKIKQMLEELGFKILEWDLYKERGDNHIVALVQK
jgi:predicted TPR repeat methyltransferase